MAAKNRRSGKAKAPRQGVSGNPQRRAEQLAQRRPVAGEPDLSPFMLDFGSRETADSPLWEMAHALAGGAEPASWWDESRQRILAAARALTWPFHLVDLETQACRIVGDEFYERLNSHEGGFHPPQWLLALADETAAELRASVADGTGDWRQLWALLRGLALTVPPGDTDSKTARLSRETFPDIRDPYRTTQAEAGRAAKLLADRGLASGLGHAVDGSRATGDALVACGGYGSRFLLAAPFGYGGKEPDHWYAWDIDMCWLPTAVGAGVFSSPEDALAEWQHAVGPAAGTALTPSTPETTARLLEPCLKTGPMSDTVEGGEPRELIREYHRLRRRAHVLNGRADVRAASAAVASTRDDDLGSVREAFLGWYAAQHDDVPAEVPDAVDSILDMWGPQAPAADRSRYACSPHRIEMTARLVRDGYFADHANVALRLLPEWTQWCIEQSGLAGDLAARARAAALTEAAALVVEEKRSAGVRQDEAPFRRHE